MKQILELKALLEEVEKAIDLLMKEHDHLELQLRENEAQIQKYKKIADSYKVVLKHLAKVNGGLDEASDFLPSQEAYFEKNLADSEPSTVTTRVRAYARSPKSMIKPQYRNMTLSQIVQGLLDNNPDKEFTTDEIIQETYTPQNYEDVKQIKTTLGPVLSRGVRRGLWRGAQGLYKSKEQE